MYIENANSEVSDVPQSGARCAACGEPSNKPERHVRMELQAWLENEDATEEQRNLGKYEDWNTQILFDSEWDSDLTFCNEECADTWAGEFADENGDANVDPRSLFTDQAKAKIEEHLVLPGLVLVECSAAEEAR